MMKMHEQAKLSIANKLRELRERNGKTQADIGRLVGRAATTIASWESGKGQPDTDTFMRLMMLYGVENVLEEFGYIRQGRVLSGEEREHVDCIRALPQGLRTLLYNLVRGMAQQEVASEPLLAIARGNGALEPLPISRSLEGLPDEGWLSDGK